VGRNVLHRKHPDAKACTDAKPDAANEPARAILSVEYWGIRDCQKIRGTSIASRVF